MELSIERNHDADDERKYFHDSYTVYVDDHRILAVSTDYAPTATRWLKEFQKSHNNKFGSLVVGVVAERRHDLMKEDNGPDAPYDILQLCVGSHSLIYHLPIKSRWYRGNDDNAELKGFQEFFADPDVIAVGVDMVAVAKNLEKHHEIKFANPTDVNEMAVKGMKRGDLDLAKYDVDRLATAVLGQEYWIERPEEEVEWFQGYRCSRDEPFTEEKVMYGTFESYFVFLIGSKLLEMMDGDYGAGSGKKSKKKKKKKRGH